ncbi:type III secretion system export apparatus subunit SctU [Oxalobacteraceae bacterium]|nr:type III secretion system export apparatus subunit SctU [Oxalobacteraceae bacterium]
MSGQKTEQPTPRKLDDARAKGQVAVSKELARLVVLVAVAETVFATETLWREAVFSLFELSLLRIGQPFPAALEELLAAATTLLLLVFLLFWIVCGAAATLTYWGQFGILISGQAIVPTFDKLNPLKGIQQLFTMKKLLELLLALGKAALIGSIVYLLVRAELPAIIGLSGGAPKDIFHGFMSLLRAVFHSVVVVCLCLGLIDFFVQKHFHTRQLMMDMEEIKKEHKETEGDPQLKGQRRQLARELAASDPVARTEAANALVVDPGHFAIALLYQPAAAGVPLVLAKGRDEQACAMSRRARERGVPVVHHAWLARTLYTGCRPDSPIPRASYEAVAHVYAALAELRASDHPERELALELHGEPPAGRGGTPGH